MVIILEEEKNQLDMIRWDIPTTTTQEDYYSNPRI